MALRDLKARLRFAPWVARHARVISESLCFLAYPGHLSSDSRGSFHSHVLVFFASTRVAKIRDDDKVNSCWQFFHCPNILRATEPLKSLSNQFHVIAESKYSSGQ